MKSVFVQEQHPYKKADLVHIFGADEAISCIKKLKEFGILKTIRKDKRFSDLSQLGDADFLIVDEEDTDVPRRYVFCFVGVIIVHGVVLKCYPKYIFGTKEPLEELKQVMNVLEKYNGKEQIIKICLNRQRDKEFNRLAAMITLLHDYEENGVYRNRQDKIETNGNGEVNWSRTINETFAVFHHGRPYYTELRTLLHQDDDQDFFRRLHACMVTLCSAELEQLSLLELLGLSKVELTDETLDDLGDSSYILKRLEQEMSVQFHTRKQSLLQVMYLMIANEGTLVDHSSFSLYGTNAYHYVWQEVCAVAMGNVLHKKLCDLSLPSGTLRAQYRRRANEKLIDIIEKPLWFDRDGNTHPASDTLIPDMVSIKEDAFYIFDAKYYAVRSEAGWKMIGQPGIGDITKQYMYQLAYQDFCKAHDFSMQKIKNCFLMPTEAGESLVDIGSVRMDMLSRLKLKDIRVIAVPARLAYQAYLTNQRISWTDTI